MESKKFVAISGYRSKCGIDIQKVEACTTTLKY